MSERKEYRSAVRSRRLIRQAFLALLKEKPFDKITVTDIVSRAELNRSTFYAHYPDIFGIVDELENEMVQKNIAIIEKIQYRNIFTDPSPYLDGIAAMMEENKELLTYLGRNQLSRSYLEKFYKLMINDVLTRSTIPESIRNSPEFAIRVHFFIGGIINTYHQWAEGELKQTPAEISKQIVKMIQKSSEDLLSFLP